MNYTTIRMRCYVIEKNNIQKRIICDLIIEVKKIEMLGKKNYQKSNKPTIQ